MNNVKIPVGCCDVSAVAYQQLRAMKRWLRGVGHMTCHSVFLVSSDQWHSHYATLLQQLQQWPVILSGWCALTLAISITAMVCLCGLRLVTFTDGSGYNNMFKRSAISLFPTSVLMRSS